MFTTEQINKLIYDLKWKIFKLFGPPEVIQMANMMDEIRDHYETETITIYAGGDYTLTVHSDDPTEGSQVLHFPTIQERNAFAKGMDYIIQSGADDFKSIDSELGESLDELNKIATHRGSTTKNN